MIRVSFYVAVIFVSCLVVLGQTPDNAKNFAKDGLSFDYPNGWVLQDGGSEDAQDLTLARSDSDVQIKIFAHKGRITLEKLADAKKSFIDPYIAATMKQFVAMGGKPVQSADASEIGGEKAEGVSINVSLDGEAGAAKIYWALVGQRVVVLTLFGPDQQIKQNTPAWDLVRTSLKTF